MARRFELIVFDWDGTLMDSTTAIVASIQAAARDLGIQAPSDERARHIIGLGLLDALRHALPDLPIERYPEVAERYRHHYLSRDQDLLLFDGAAALIEELKLAGHYLAVATGKTRKGLDRAFEVSGLGTRFDASRCADECHSKPHPPSTRSSLAQIGPRVKPVAAATLPVPPHRPHSRQGPATPGPRGNGPHRRRRAPPHRRSGP